MTPSPTERQSETKILFLDGAQPRILKGTITNEDSDFIELSRADGQVRINKKFVIKIETRVRGTYDIKQ